MRGLEEKKQQCECVSVITDQLPQTTDKLLLQSAASNLRRLECWLSLSQFVFTQWISKCLRLNALIDGVCVCKCRYVLLKAGWIACLDGFCRWMCVFI